MHLTLHLTSQCNLRCKYCYDGSHQGGDMSFETAKGAIGLAIAENRAKTPGQSLGIAFFGGEPLLRKDLIKEVIQHCRRLTEVTGQEFNFKMTTNGLLLDESFLFGPETRDIFIAISHDGIRVAHDTNRVDTTDGGSFERLEPIIKMLLDYKPNTPAMMTLTPETAPHLSESIQYLYKQGFRYLIPTLNYAGNWQDKDLRYLRREYKKLADWYYQATIEEEKFYLSPFETAISSHIHPGSCRAERCELGKNHLSIAPNGRIYPCVQFAGDGSDMEYAIGHVDSGLNEEARDRLMVLSNEEKDGCHKCAIRERCRHYCGCINRNATGSINRVAPVLCAHERMLLPIADRLAGKLYKKRNPMFIHKHYNDLYPLISFIEDRMGQQK